MTDKKISELTQITGADVDDANDELAIVDSSASETKAITRGELFSGLDNLSVTYDSITTNEATLAAIAETKGDTAVDVFVYDTSRDSDGGAWRKRTQHTSWYNETLNTSTRGSRREFPAVAVIVAESNKVTIYDGDDPSLPMWMVFEGGGSNWLYYVNSATDTTSIYALNGKIVSGNELYDMRIWDFPLDGSVYWRERGVANYYGTVSNRNDGLGQETLSSGSSGIVNRAVNDVAMTILPDSPIDPATGLPVPTIAVATEGGVSVIKDDGTVVDSSETAGMALVAFNDSNRLFYNDDASDQVYYADIYDSDGFSDGHYDTDAAPYTLPGNVTALALDAIGQADGLTILAENPDTQANGMVALLTSTYNTGWMNGDIKGAFLSDTDDTDLVGSGELVTNGTFDTDTTGWTLTETGTGVAEWDSGTQSIKLTRNDLSNRGVASQTVSGTSGKLYLLTFDILAASDGNAAVSINGVSSGQFTPNQKVLYHFTSDGSDLIEFLPQTNGGTTVYIDNISIKLADEDRSVNNNGLIVNGTITREPVAPGADLVTYSGFSASNYLEQPYNPDLDFGTGDFCVMGWVTLGDATQRIIQRSDNGSGVGTNGSWAVLANSGKWQFQTALGLDDSGVAYVEGSPQFVCVTVSGGVLQYYVNGVKISTHTKAYNFNGTGAPKLYLGTGRFSGSPANVVLGNMALWRISGTAPTAEQIAKIYNDEKVLFQENAQATLYGSSDAVTALAHDPVTDLLHVGTSDGRSVFQGLRRVSNTTDAVGTAISASNNLISWRNNHDSSD